MLKEFNELVRGHIPKMLMSEYRKPNFYLSVSLNLAHYFKSKKDSSPKISLLCHVPI